MSVYYILIDKNDKTNKRQDKEQIVREKYAHIKVPKRKERKKNWILSYSNILEMYHCTNHLPWYIVHYPLLSETWLLVIANIH